MNEITGQDKTWKALSIIAEINHHVNTIIANVEPVLLPEKEQVETMEASTDVNTTLQRELLVINNRLRGLAERIKI